MSGRTRCKKDLNELSRATVYRRRNEQYLKCFTNRNVSESNKVNEQSNFSDESNQEFDDVNDRDKNNNTIQFEDSYSDGPDYNFETIDSFQSITANNDLQSDNDLNENESPQILNEESDTLSNASSAQSDDSNQKGIHLNKLNDFNKNVISELADFFITGKMSKSTLNKVAKLIYNVMMNKDKIQYFPNSSYKLLKLFESKIKATFSFKCDCGHEFIDFKSIGQLNCPNEDCSKSFTTKQIISSRRYFFRFNLRNQLELILNEFDLDYNEKGRVFKIFSDLKKDIVSLTIFVDGVPVFKNNLQLWPLFISINNLKAPLCTKTFLNACLIDDKKPDADTIRFFMNDLIDELNQLFDEGKIF